MALVESGERGDPMSPLRWTLQSLRQLAAELAARGHRVSRTVVGELLKRQTFSLQGNIKTREGGDHADRDAQFIYINRSVTAALAAQQPVISVDTNKIEHRLFSFISMNWRAKPLVSYRVIVDLISATKTNTGLTVCCEPSRSPAAPAGRIRLTPGASVTAVRDQ